MKPISPRCFLPLALSFFCISAFAEEPSPEAPAVTDVDVAHAEKLLAETEGIVVLDIRTPAEFAAGHIPEAINIDFLSADFAEKIAALDPAKPFLVHCASGGRSGKSMEAFQKKNFRAIYHLTPGMNGWKAAGKPMEKP